MDSTVKKIVGFGVAAVVGLISLFFLLGSIGYNSSEDWQVHQSMLGTMSIIDRPGYYINMWGRVWTYPRYVEYYYTADSRPKSPTDESIRVTFNDGGTAQIDAFVKIKTPVEVDKRLEYHQIMRGSEENSRDAVEAHLINCIKAAGPLMSSSQNQSARKAEFNQVVEDMLRDGLFVMKQQLIDTDAVVVNDSVENTAEGAAPGAAKTIAPIKVLATEIIIDPKTGKAKIGSESPLKRYGMFVEQFSIVETAYDPDTLKQFAAKKQSFLLAEQAKAEQQRAVQERLRIRAEGESKVEEIKQQGEQEKKKAIVSAEKEAEVAEIAKKQAVTQAEQKVEVALQAKKEAETLKEIASIDAATAEEKKKAEISLAEGKQKSLEIGGALSEETKMKIATKADRDARVAEALSKIKMPGVMFVGGQGTGAGGGEANLQNNLITLTLLKSLGILDAEDDGVFTPKAKEQLKR